MEPARPPASTIAACCSITLIAIALLSGCGGGSSNGDGSTTNSTGEDGANEGGSARSYGTETGGSSRYPSEGGGSDESGAVAKAKGPATVKVAGVGDLGPVLTDGSGRTLYLFERDSAGRSRCAGACAQAWPPLLTQGAPKAMGAARRSDLGTARRADGTTQVTYSGWPLYRYRGDTAPGTANGHDVDSFGAEWYALTPAGVKAED